MALYKKTITILFCLVFCQFAFAKQIGNIAVFQKLETSQDRIAFINSAFSEIDLAAYDSLLPILIEKKDIKTELFWHHRKHISLSIFPLSIAEKEKNLQEMLQKAQKYQDKVAEIVANLHIDFLKHEQKQISTVELYYKNLKYFEEIKKNGFSQFWVYDLNMLLWQMGKDLAEYWQTEKGFDFLLAAEQNHQSDTVGRFYHTEVLSAIRNSYYIRGNFEPANAYSQKICNIHQSLNPNADPKLWWSLYWQTRATFEIATLYYETLRLKRDKYKANLGHQRDSLCQVDTLKAIELCNAYLQKGLKLYKQPFDLQMATKVQLMMEYNVLEELTNLQVSLGRLPESKDLLARMEAIQKKLDFAHTEDFMKRWGLYRNYEKYYLAKHDYKNAYKYKNLIAGLDNQLYQRNAQKQLEDMKQVHQIDKYDVQIQGIEKEKNRQQNLSITAVIFAVVASLLGYFVYRKIKKDKDVIALQKAQLEQSLGEKETLLKEIHHRVKNNLQIISGLLEKQAMKTKDEEAKKLMKEGQNRVFSMALVHQNLYQSENLSAIEIKSYLEVLTQNIQKSQIAKDQEIALVLDIDDSTVDIDTAIPLGLILNELITNCYKYAFQGREKGKIEIAFHQKDKKFDLSIADDGVGMANHFDIKKARSLGLNLVNGLVRQLDATLKMQTGENGTLFQISFVG